MMSVGLLLASLTGSSSSNAAAAPGAWIGLHNPSSDAGLEGCALKEGGPCAIHANVTFYTKTVSPIISHRLDCALLLPLC